MKKQKLVINKNFKEKLKKFKLMKIPASFVVAAVSINLLLTGCFPNKLNMNNYGNNNTSYVETYDDSNAYSTPEENSTTYLSKKSYENSDVFLTNEMYENFIKYIDEIETVYEYESYYKIDDALEKYENSVGKKATSHTHKLDSITEKSLYDKVKENNKVYLEEKQKEYVSNFYEEFSDDELKEICNIINDVVNKYVSNNKIEDIDELKCVLGNLKVYKRISMSNAYVTDDDCMIISPRMIESVGKINNDNEDPYKSVVVHETMHLLQKNCCDNMKNKKSIGNSTKFDDIKINSLYWEWFYEGCAEKLCMNYTNDDAITYKNYIGYIESFSLSTILYEGNYEDQIIESSLSKNLNPLFKAFNANTKEQQKEIIKMMFSLDIIQCLNEDFVKEVYGELDYDDQEYASLARNLKNSIFETMTKSFYKSLAESLKNNKLKLNDVFYMITIYENDLNNHIMFAEDEERLNDAKTFLNEYKDIQSNFFKYLSNSVKIDENELIDRFNSYSLEYNNDGIESKSISQEKQNFFKKMQQNNSYNLTTHISNLVENTNIYCK